MVVHSVAFIIFMATAHGTMVAFAQPSMFNVHWSSPSSGPGRTQKGLPTFQDAMPIGNGRVTALAWANTSIGGIGVYLGSQEAMSGQTDLFKLGHFQLAVTPNPFTPGADFNQTCIHWQVG